MWQSIGKWNKLTQQNQQIPKPNRLNHQPPVGDDRIQHAHCSYYRQCREAMCFAQTKKPKDHPHRQDFKRWRVSCQVLLHLVTPCPLQGSKHLWEPGNLFSYALLEHPAFLGTLLSSGACLLELCSSKACLWKAFIKEPCTYIMRFTSLNTFLCSVCGLVWFWSLALKTLETHCCRDSS